MQPSPIPISMLRYLIAWKVNSAFVTLPEYLPIELSLVLGTIISNRLASQEAGPWKKALAPLAEFHAQVSDREQNVTVPFPATSWPLETVLFSNQPKRAYGFGELIFWELKLLGESADHGLFLELILPAMEEAGYKAPAPWLKQNRLWGHFEIDSIYVAHGKTWKPLVQAGKLDLRYRPTPVQWAEGLTFKPDAARVFRNLHWLTPFDLMGEAPQEVSGDHLRLVLEALLTRVNRLIVTRHKSHEGVATILNAAGQAALQTALALATACPLLAKNLDRAPSDWPGAWMGTQTFAPIPPALLPYLDLASILHIGKYAHFGCGTFQLN